MFFFQRKNREVQLHTIKIRDEWGTLHKICLIRGASLLSDQELANQCEVSANIVQRHWRDQHENQ